MFYVLMLLGAMCFGSFIAGFILGTDIANKLHEERQQKNGDWDSL